MFKHFLGEGIENEFVTERCHISGIIRMPISQIHLCDKMLAQLAHVGIYTLRCKCLSCSLKHDKVILESNIGSD